MFTTARTEFYGGRSVGGVKTKRFYFTVSLKIWNVFRCKETLHNYFSPIDLLTIILTEVYHRLTWCVARAVPSVAVFNRSFKQWIEVTRAPCEREDIFCGSVDYMVSEKYPAEEERPMRPERMISMNQATLTDAIAVIPGLIEENFTALFASNAKLE